MSLTEKMVPAFDYPAGTDHALERLTARPGRVELAAIGQPAGVLGGDQGTFDGGFAVSLDQVDDLQFLAHGYTPNAEKQNRPFLRNAPVWQVHAEVSGGIHPRNASGQT